MVGGWVGANTAGPSLSPPPPPINRKKRKMSTLPFLSALEGMEEEEDEEIKRKGRRRKWKRKRKRRRRRRRRRILAKKGRSRRSLFQHSLSLFCSSGAGVTRKQIF